MLLELLINKPERNQIIYDYVNTHPDKKFIILGQRVHQFDILQSYFIKPSQIIRLDEAKMNFVKHGDVPFTEDIVMCTAATFKEIISYYKVYRRVYPDFLNQYDTVILATPFGHVPDELQYINGTIIDIADRDNFSLRSLQRKRLYQYQQLEFIDDLSTEGK